MLRRASDRMDHPAFTSMNTQRFALVDQQKTQLAAFKFVIEIDRHGNAAVAQRDFKIIAVLLEKSIASKT